MDTKWNTYSKSRLQKMGMGGREGLVAHACNPRTQEVIAGELLWIWGQSGLYGECQARVSYKMKTCLKNQTQIKQKPK